MAKTKKKTAKKASKKVAPKSVAKQVHASALGISLLGDRVLVKPEEVEMKTASGIIIPDTVKKEKMMTGRVVAVGPGRFGDEADVIPMTVKLDDTVYFSRGWDEDSSKFTWKGEEYFLIAESDIKAVIN